MARRSRRGTSILRDGIRDAFAAGEGRGEGRVTLWDTTYMAAAVKHGGMIKRRGRRTRAVA